MELSWGKPTGPMACIGRDETLSLRLTVPGEARRQTLEAFIRERFAERYGARIRHFMPCLLGLEDADGGLRAAVGLRGAEQGALFLERYLDAPVEQVIAAERERPVTRDQVIEVGNLAALGSGASRLLIVALTDLLVAHGFRWVVFTGTASLLNSFQRLGLAPSPLADADPTRMGDEQADWGRYYEARPQVMVGDILGGHQRLLQLGLYSRLGYRALFTQEALSHVACS